MAITTNWALYLLAANPEVQEWLREVILAVVIKDDNIQSKYQEYYPKLNRCLAVLLETLRLFNPLIGIAKLTGAEPQPLTLNGKTIVIPSNTHLIPNINAMHSHPKYWGPDALIWRPNRWVLSRDLDSETQIQEKNLPNKSINPKSTPEEEFLFSPQKEKDRIDVVPEKGESLEEARKRAEKSVWDSEIVLLLQMKKSELVGVK